MARLPYLSTADLDPADHELLARDLNLYRALAHSPNGARAFAAPALYVRHDSTLNPRLRELAILQIGYATKTEYEYAHHVELGLEAGLTPADIRAIASASRGGETHFTELENAVLAAARALVSSPSLDDATYAALQSGLNNEQLLDLIVVISTYCGVVRLLGALQIDLEEPYRRYLTEYPLG